MRITTISAMFRAFGSAAAGRRQRVVPLFHALPGVNRGSSAGVRPSGVAESREKTRTAALVTLPTEERPQ
jgi:hypothetical protein